MTFTPLAFDSLAVINTRSPFGSAPLQNLHRPEMVRTGFDYFRIRVPNQGGACFVCRWGRWT